MQVIAQAHEQYKQANRAALVEAAKSLAQTLGLLAGTFALGAGVLWYVAREGRANPAIATAGLLGTAVAGGWTLVRSIDAKQDVDLWLHLNSGERRAHFTTSMFTAQAEAMTRLSTVWADNAIAANAWQLQQWQQSQISRPLPQTLDAQAAPVATVPALPPLYDLAADLGQHPQSAIIAGVPGAGKGMVVSNALRHLKARYPNITIFVIDPKADPKESGYWEGIGATVRRCRFLGADADDCALWLLKRLEEFAAIQGPKLMVFDEGSAAIATLKLAHKDIKAMGRLKAFIAHISSMGDSGETWLWLMAQIIHVADLGMSGGFRGIFRAVGIVSPKNRYALQSFLATDFVPMPDGGMPEIETLMNSSPVGRAFFDGKSNQWVPMPRLQNWSGYDRDTRQALPGANVPATLTTTPEALSLERAWENSPDLPVSCPMESSQVVGWMDWLRGRGETTVRDCQQFAPGRCVWMPMARPLLLRLSANCLLTWQVLGRGWLQLGIPYSPLIPRAFQLVASVSKRANYGRFRWLQLRLQTGYSGHP
ncbi:MAG: hypothetical protein HC771_21260 [Synechococcales cyanobacterium CRU_2_2]|nr:hypothetical protein [Synechococcales cyanobacterium CRU_2_2]